jgi:ubiquinone/menaquinone biosynthesis C-methylase UbiE
VDPSALANALATWIGVADGSRYLDLGCGEGATLAALRGNGGAWVGLDVRPGKLAAARAAAPGSPLVRAKGGRLPFRDHAFHGGVCLAGLGRFVDPVHPLAEAARVVIPAGRVAVCVDGVPEAELHDVFLAAGFHLGEELSPGIRGATRVAPTPAP